MPASRCDIPVHSTAYVLERDAHNRVLSTAPRIRPLTKTKMDVIAKYKQYMRNRSGCRNVSLIYKSPCALSTADYYAMIRSAENLFFVIAIGDSQVIYYWKKPTMLNGLNLITNNYTDDCEYIIEYDTLQKTELMFQKVCLYNEIRKKALQTAVFIKGECQQIPEPFTYDELDLTAFPDTAKISNTSIRMETNDLFRVEAYMEDGTENIMTIKKTGSVFENCGVTTEFDCKLYVFKAFN